MQDRVGLTYIQYRHSIIQLISVLQVSKFTLTIRNFKAVLHASNSEDYSRLEGLHTIDMVDDVGIIRR